MLQSYSLRDGHLRRNQIPSKGPEAIEIPVDSLWVDILDPTSEERDAVTQLFGFEPPTRNDLAEIEISSRLYDEGGASFMTVLVLSQSDTERPRSQPISFVLAGDRLMTVRYSDPLPFATFTHRAERQTNQWTRGDIILVGLLEAIIERLGDVLENIGREVEEISEVTFAEDGIRNARDYQRIILRIGKRSDLTSKARESLLSIGRLLTFLSQALEAKGATDLRSGIKVMTRDVRSLVDHATYLSSEISFLLDAVLGIVSIDESRIIKIFSVMAVVFLPPTLIASVYGMNFEYMPELRWVSGYPASLALMVISAVLPYLYFKWRGWM
jgi:magnesium transporter